MTSGLGLITTHNQYKCVKTNMLSATQHPQVVLDYITSECTERRMLDLQQPDQVDGSSLQSLWSNTKENSIREMETHHVLTISKWSQYERWD